MKTRLDAAGRLDMLAGLGTEVKRYYETLSRMPGGMPREDEIRMAEAIELIGEAEHDVRQARSGARDVARGARAAARPSSATDTTASDAPAAADDRAARLREPAACSRSAASSTRRSSTSQQAKTAYDELLDEDPTVEAVLLGAADTHDRLGDLLRIDGKIDRGVRRVHARQGRARARDEPARTARSRSTKMLALSTSHFKLGSVYQNRGESQTALDEYQHALQLRETLLESHAR